MFWVLGNMKYYTDAATKEGGKVVYNKPTFVGSDGKTYYAPEED